MTGFMCHGLEAVVGGASAPTVDAPPRRSPLQEEGGQGGRSLLAGAYTYLPIVAGRADPSQAVEVPDPVEIEPPASMNERLVCLIAMIESLEFAPRLIVLRDELGSISLHVTRLVPSASGEPRYYVVVRHCDPDRLIDLGTFCDGEIAWDFTRRLCGAPPPRPQEGEAGRNSPAIPASPSALTSGDGLPVMGDGNDPKPLRASSRLRVNLSRHQLASPCPPFDPAEGHAQSEFIPVLGGPEEGAVSYMDVDPRR